MDSWNWDGNLSRKEWTTDGIRLYKTQEIPKGQSYPSTSQALVNTVSKIEQVLTLVEVCW